MRESVEGLKRRGLARSLNILLGVLAVLILALGIIRVAGLTISIVTDYEEGWEFDVPVAIGEGSFYTDLRLDTVEDEASGFTSKRISQARGKLILYHYSLPLHSIRQVLHLVMYAVLLWAIILLRRIFSTTRAGRPFDPMNPGRLNILGWIIICWSAVDSLQKYLVSGWVLPSIEPVNVPLVPSVDLNLEWMMCGFVVLLLAAIWKEAVVMAEEQSLTV